MYTGFKFHIRCVGTLFWLLGVKMYRLLLVYFLLIHLSDFAFANQTLSATKHGLSISFGDYEPRQPESLDELPKNIREKLKLHLQDRLGIEFFKTLRFVDGQIIDLNELYKENPNSKDYKWEVPTYVLNFEFSMPDKGIDSYVANIELRSDGSVVKEIDLPSFGSDPQKLNFIPAQFAFDNAIPKDLIPHIRPGVDIEYLPDKDILVWRFSRLLVEDKSWAQAEYIDINMHTGDLAQRQTVNIDY